MRLLAVAAAALVVGGGSTARVVAAWRGAGFAIPDGARATSRTALGATAVQSIPASSQLAQLTALGTVLSIDSGDLQVIRDFAGSGYITDATTNPLFVSQAGQSGDPVYQNMVERAVHSAVQEASKNKDGSSSTTVVARSMDYLAVYLGKAISELVPGYISTEVDPRLSFDVAASVERGRRLVQLYDELGVPSSRVLIKLAATWEGIQAAHILETEFGIRCNLTLIFSTVQAIAAAQYGAHLVSPFPGRIWDWYNLKGNRPPANAATEDEGVVACRDIYNYYKQYGHNTICMPASWRPSRGHDLDEIRALAGTDRMTIPAPLLRQLAECEDPLPSQLSVEAATTTPKLPLVGGGRIGEAEFRYRMAMDGCGNDKLAEGIRSFVELTEKLEAVMTDQVQAALRGVSSSA